MRHLILPVLSNAMISSSIEYSKRVITRATKPPSREPEMFSTGGDAKPGMALNSPFEESNHQAEALPPTPQSEETMTHRFPSNHAALGVSFVKTAAGIAKPTSRRMTPFGAT